ncbi:unnamed protein product [Cylicostephanus goldi]|uniref:Peptidase C19 ubiquitin carboxyl-terminal hydrolase domain-containing protein n=1 Tax=Cylicostephanus goldi TaxID=71465 RepID=A0A3P6RLE4_CYLGO|nr:unnamed protein product [Cylicostephanus goldi]
MFHLQVFLNKIVTGSKPAGVPGLRNLGNTCYANALLQGISSLPSMVRWLKEIDTSTSELKYGFLDELKEVVLSEFSSTSSGFLEQMIKRSNLTGNLYILACRCIRRLKSLSYASEELALPCLVLRSLWLWER